MVIAHCGCWQGESVAVKGDFALTVATFKDISFIVIPVKAGMTVRMNDDYDE